MPIWGHVELLCRSIAEEGRKEAEQILTRARLEAAEVMAAARDRADREYQEGLLAGTSEAYAKAKRLVDSAELEAKRQLMSFREQVIQEIFSALAQRLQAYRNEPGYAKFLLSALKEGIDRLSGTEFVVELNGEDVRLLESEVNKLAEEQALRIELAASPACDGGLRIITRDHRQLFDNSFTARLERGANAIRQEIGRVILGA